MCYFFFQAEDGIRDLYVTGVQTCALPISSLSIGKPHRPTAYRLGQLLRPRDDRDSRAWGEESNYRPITSPRAHKEMYPTSAMRKTPSIFCFGRVRYADIADYRKAVDKSGLPSRAAGSKIMTQVSPERIIGKAPRRANRRRGIRFANCSFECATRFGRGENGDPINPKSHQFPIRRGQNEGRGFLRIGRLCLVLKGGDSARAARP